MTKHAFENFNDYLTIIMQSSETFKIIFEELQELINSGEKQKALTYIDNFKSFNEDFILSKAKTISEPIIRFEFVDRSFLLLDELKRVKRNI